jgi:1,4-alpha-glucan branching enzyme
MTTVGTDGTVEFWFYRRDAARVSVVGDFAGRCAGTLEMERGPDGWWYLNKTLDAGEYRFRYAADGEWFPDYASNGIELGECGVSSVLIVPERVPGLARLETAKLVA